jgi:hypothetical protein
VSMVTRAPGLEIAIAMLLLGCDAALDGPATASSGVRDAAPASAADAGPMAPIEASLDAIDPADARLYLSFVAPALIERTLDATERDAIAARGGAAIPEVLEGWRDAPGLARAARRMIETALAVSGGLDPSGIDFGMPGRIVERVVREQRPWGEILTSESCVDPSGASVECDTGAPYTAGVLTTRAFLAARQGRFNLTRAGTVTRTFLCRNYPVPTVLEPLLERELLLPMFRALSREEQTDPEAAMSGLANGFHCYACHGQFGAHAQLFVRFDASGRWRSDATGEQLEGGMPGESFGGLMASHLLAPRAASEESQMLGQSVANLAEAMEALTSSTAFLECASRRVLELAIDIDPAEGIEAALLTDIAEDALARGARPTFQDLMISALAHPRVAATTARQLREVSP